MICEHPECREPAVFHIGSDGTKHHLCKFHVHEYLNVDTSSSHAVAPIAIRIQPLTSPVSDLNIEGFGGLSISDSIAEYGFCVSANEELDGPVILVSESDLCGDLLSKLEFVFFRPMTVLTVPSDAWQGLSRLP